MVRAARFALLLLVIAPLALAPATADDDVHVCTGLPADQCTNAYLIFGDGGVETYGQRLELDGDVPVRALEAHDGRLYVAREDGTVASTDGLVWRDEATIPPLPRGSCMNHVSLASYNGDLYAASSALAGPTLWRLDEAVWTPVLNGLGPGCHAWAMHVFGGSLYIGTSGSRAYAWDGANLRLALDIGAGLGGAVTSFADDGSTLYAATFRGLRSTTNGVSWSLSSPTQARISSVVVSGSLAWVTSGDSLVAVQGSSYATKRTWPGEALEFVGDAFGMPAPAVGTLGTAASVKRYDHFGTTTLIDAWGIPTGMEEFDGDLFVSNALDGRVLRIERLVEVRPLI